MNNICANCDHEQSYHQNGVGKCTWHHDIEKTECICFAFISSEDKSACELPKKCQVKNCHNGFITRYIGGSIDTEACRCLCHKPSELAGKKEKLDVWRNPDGSIAYVRSDDALGSGRNKIYMHDIVTVKRPELKEQSEALGEIVDAFDNFYESMASGVFTNNKKSFEDFIRTQFPLYAAKMNKVIGLDGAIEQCIGVRGNHAFDGSYAAPREAFREILKSYAAKREEAAVMKTRDEEAQAWSKLIEAARKEGYEKHNLEACAHAQLAKSEGIQAEKLRILKVIDEMHDGVRDKVNGELNCPCNICAAEKEIWEVYKKYIKKVIEATE